MQAELMGVLRYLAGSNDLLVTTLIDRKVR